MDVADQAAGFSGAGSLYGKLSPADVLESILNAHEIAKIIRSRSPARSRPVERLYVLKSLNFSGTLVYTKGTIRREDAKDVFYVLVSAKIATIDD